MLSLPHGIRQAFLRPVWAPFRRCLPLLALLHRCPEDGDDDDLRHQMTNYSMQAGCLVPMQSGDEEPFTCSAAAHEGKCCVEEGILLPITEAPDPQEYEALAAGDNETLHKEQACCLVPNTCREEEDAAETICLMFSARICGDIVPHADLQQNEKGGLLWLRRGEDKTAWQTPDNEAKAHGGCSVNSIMPVTPFISSISFHTLNLLCFLNFQEAYVFVPLLNDEDVDDADSLYIRVFDPGGLNFTPLRGRICRQGREMQAAMVEMQRHMKVKSKLHMKMLMMQMRLLYITKDLLDPG